MDYRFEFRRYRRQFCRSLQTAQGFWEAREGIILRLTDAAGRMGFGEIAPLEWLGSESLTAALDFCQQLSTSISTNQVWMIPDCLPACQFGFASAWYQLEQPPMHLPLFNYSGLLPAGTAALSAWQNLWQQGYRTFKWKIAVAPLVEELQVLKQLVQALPMTAKLRLDANAGLDIAAAKQWLEACESVEQIEFLEQPLDKSEFAVMWQLSQHYSTPLALDESVVTIAQLESCYQQGWRGIFVVKPAIAGNPRRLQQFCQDKFLDLVFSSVFETAIGQRAALQLAATLAETTASHRAIGFGVNHWFVDTFNQMTAEELWDTLPPL